MKGKSKAGKAPFVTNSRSRRAIRELAQAAATIGRTRKTVMRATQTTRGTARAQHGAHRRRNKHASISKSWVSARLVFVLLTWCRACIASTCGPSCVASYYCTGSLCDLGHCSKRSIVVLQPSTRASGCHQTVLCSGNVAFRYRPPTAVLLRKRRAYERGWHFGNCSGSVVSGRPQSTQFCRPLRMIAGGQCKLARRFAYFSSATQGLRRLFAMMAWGELLGSMQLWVMCNLIFAVAHCHSLCCAFCTFSPLHTCVRSLIVPRLFVATSHLALTTACLG